MIQFDKYNNTYVKSNQVLYSQAFKHYVEDVVSNIFLDSQIFDTTNIRLYYYDDYTLNTNVIENNYATLYVEFDCPENIKKDVGFTKKKEQKKLLKDYYLDLKDIRLKLYEELINYFNSDTMFWLDKYSIRTISNVKESDDSIKNYQFRIIPCFTYVNENNIKGIIYYDNSRTQIEIEYPLRSIENFNEKNIDTNGAYQKTVLIFKNIYRLSQKITEYLPSEIFEILLYNIPNNIFLVNNDDTFIKVFNYLKNKSIKDFKTLDEQDFAFSSKYKSLSLLYAKKVISVVEKFLKEKI